MPINSFDNYPMSWKPNLNNITSPIYISLADMLENDIKTGKLTAGTKLPPQRELADFLDINLSTISRAFKLCEQKGLIIGSTGKGTFVSSDVAYNPILLNDINNFSLIEMGAIFPSTASNIIVADCLKDMTKEPNFYKLFQYGLQEKSINQKEVAASWIKKANYTTSPSNITLAGGGQNAIMATLASLFKPGDSIGTAYTTYLGMKAAAKLCGIQLVPIEQDGNEISEKGIIYACKNNNIKGLFIVPDLHNPTTHTISIKTREMIASISKKYNLIIIEDAVNSLLYETPLPPVAYFAPKNTIYISSLSKVVSPGLRVSFIAADEKYIDKLNSVLYSMNIAITPLLAELSTRLIQSGKADLIANERRNYNIAHNKIINKHLNEFEILGDLESIFRWLILPSNLTGRKFESLAKEVGVQVYASERFTVGNSHYENAVRIAISSTKTEEEFITGVNILKSLLYKDALI